MANGWRLAGLLLAPAAWLWIAAGQGPVLELPTIAPAAPAAAPLLSHVLYLPGVAVDPTPPPGGLTPSMAALQAELERTVAAHPEAGRVAVAVTDLATGQTASVHGSRRQFAGCIANMFGLVLALRDVHEGRYPLEAVADLVRTTVRYSNPTTARELYRIAGNGDVLEGVRRASEEVGSLLAVEGLNLDHPPGYLGDSIGGGEANLASAEALNALMAALYHGDLVPPPEQAFLLEAMDNVYPGLNYLLGVLYENDGVSVRHKNGFFEWADGFVDNDSGIVLLSDEGGDGAAFAITFLAEAVPAPFADVPLAQELARLAYAHFGEP